METKCYNRIEGGVIMKTGRPGKKIMCINDGNVFSSITAASEFYSVSRSAISKQLMGIRSQVAGRYYIYVHNSASEDELKEIRQNKIKEIYNLDNM